MSKELEEGRIRTADDPAQGDQSKSNAAVTTISATDGRKDTALQRLGPKTLIVLVGSLIVEIAAIGFIAFLWYGDISNGTWHDIVVRNWTTRAVTLTALALRIGMGLQGALCISMLAAITVERLSVPVQNAADVSLMRAGNKTDMVSVLLGFLYPIVKNNESRKAFRATLLLTLAILTTITLSQFASTTLVGDLSEQMIPGKNVTSAVAYDYPFTNAKADLSSTRGNSWLKSKDGKTTYGYTYPGLTTAASLWQMKTPLFWPAFAEYSEPPHVADGVSDTGLSLRAFLPYVQPNSRETIRNYTGMALVLDSRVTCQKPKLSGAKYNLVADDDAWPEDNFIGTLEGSIAPTVDTPVQNWPVGHNRPFQCIEALTSASSVGRTYDWSICQILPENINPDSLDTALGSFPAGLNSVFRKSKAAQTGSSFILMQPLPQGNSGEALKTPLNFDKGSAWARVSKGDISGNQFTSDFAMTLCHASYDVADRFIVAHSSANRTEPTTLWDKDKNSLDLSAVLRQLDTGYQTAGGKLPSLEDRGVLRLQGRANNDWSISSTAPNIDGADQLPAILSSLNADSFTATSENNGPVSLTPYILAAMNIQGGLHTPSAIKSTVLAGNWTAVLNDVTFNVPLPGDKAAPPLQAVSTQRWVPALVNSYLDHPALAMQALITSFAGMAYYDRITQYTKEADASQVFFVVVQSPGGPFGARRKGLSGGFIAVVVVLIVHLALITAILVKFVAQTRLTRIGDGWQAVGQVGLSDGCKDIMNTAAVPGGGRAVVGDGHHVSLNMSGEKVKFVRKDTA